MPLMCSAGALPSVLPFFLEHVHRSKDVDTLDWEGAASLEAVGNVLLCCPRPLCLPRPLGLATPSDQDNKVDGSKSSLHCAFSVDSHLFVLDFIYPDMCLFPSKPSTS